VVLVVAAVVAVAAQPTKKSVFPATVGRGEVSGEAIEVIDYWIGTGSLWTWGGTDFYLANIFKPNLSWYPLNILRLEIIFGEVDAGAFGTVNRVRIFGPLLTVLGEVVNQAGVGTTTWVPFTFATPISIAAGDFIGGAWNTPYENNLGGTATGWPPGVPTEPQIQVYGGASSGATTGWATSQIGVGYPTISCAVARAIIDSNIPVELMRFEIE
jgi:hypothetical protein